MGKQIERIPNETMDALPIITGQVISGMQNLMERAVLLSVGSSLRVPLAEILTDSGSQRGWQCPRASRARADCGALRESNGLSEACVERQSPGSQENVARYKMQKWVFLATPVTDVRLWRQTSVI